MIYLFEVFILILLKVIFDLQKTKVFNFNGKVLIYLMKEICWYLLKLFRTVHYFNFIFLHLTTIYASFFFNEKRIS